MDKKPVFRRRRRSPGEEKPKRSIFIRGVITILPAVLTLFILVTAVRFVQDYIITPVNTTIYWLLEGNTLGWKVLDKLDIDPLQTEFLDTSVLPEDVTKVLSKFQPWDSEYKNSLQAYREPNLGFFRDLNELAIEPDYLRKKVSLVVHPAVGALMSLLVVVLLGYFTSGFIGRRMIGLVDRTATNLPIIRSVYPYTKQLVQFFAAETDFDFNTVVAAPYPSDGVWAIAFVTSSGLKTVHEALEDRYVSIFVPTSPMPATGFTVFIREDRLIPLPISVDEALRVTVSAGVLIPGSEMVEDLEESLVQLGAELQERNEGTEGKE